MLRSRLSSSLSYGSTTVSKRSFPARRIVSPVPERKPRTDTEFSLTLKPRLPLTSDLFRANVSIGRIFAVTCAESVPWHSGGANPHQRPTHVDRRFPHRSSRTFAALV